MAITLLPPAPLRTDDPDLFIEKTDVFLPALNTFATEANELANNMNSVAMGGAFAFTYKYSSSVGAAPANTFLTLSNASVSLVNTIRISNLDLGSISRLAEMKAAVGSDSAVKGTIKLVKLSDPTRFAVFNVTSIADASGYEILTVVFISSNGGATPFVGNDTLAVYIQRAGDIGPVGRLQRRATTAATFSTLTVSSDAWDLVAITALASTCQLQAPTGTPSDGQTLQFRIKDNGTSRLLSWNAIFRGGTDLTLPPATTANKTMYIGFQYNAADTKWDLVAVLNGI